jgi:hypothetical protein
MGLSRRLAAARLIYWREDAAWWVIVSFEVRRYFLNFDSKMQQA